MQTLTLMGLGFLAGFATFALAAAVRIAKDRDCRRGLAVVAVKAFRR